MEPNRRPLKTGCALLMAAATVFGTAAVAHPQTAAAAAGPGPDLPLPANLPNPLTFANGKPVAREAWPRRREELLHLFTEQMYGRMPPRPAKMRFQVLERDPHALHGLATRQQVRILFAGQAD